MQRPKPKEKVLAEKIYRKMLRLKPKAERQPSELEAEGREKKY